MAYLARFVWNQTGNCLTCADSDKSNISVQQCQYKGVGKVGHSQPHKLRDIYMGYRKVTAKTKDGRVIDGLDIPIVESIERFSEFTLEDGTVLRAKPMIVSVTRSENEWDSEGNPVYHCKNAVIITVKEIQDTLKRDP